MFSVLAATVQLEGMVKRDPLMITMKHFQNACK